MFTCDDGVQPVCLVCGATVAVCRKYNLEKHYTKNHPELVAKYPTDSLQRRTYIKMKENSRKSQQSLILKSTR